MISAKDNELIKQVSALMSSAKCRRESGSFAAEGVRLCADGVQSGAEALCFLYTDAARKKYSAEFGLVSSSAGRCEEISESLFRKIADTQNPQGFMCVFKKLDKNDRSYTINNQGRYAALENIQDPSNMGTILRTAEALGADGVILSEDCCDIYSPKVVRGSMGAVFRLPFIIKGDFTEYIRSVSDDNIRTFASTPRNAVSIEKADFSAGGIMLIGNEGSGLCEETIDACTDRVMIPMLGRAESLNASSAASILLYKLISSQKLG